MDQFSPEDEISQGPEREPRLRLPSFPRWPPEIAAFWVMAGVLAIASVLTIADIVTGHGRTSAAPPAEASNSSSMTVISGAGASFTVSGTTGISIVNCNEESWWHLGPNWQADSVRAGPLWFIGARDEGYVRPGGPPAGKPGVTFTPVTATAGGAGNGSPDNWLMVVHADPGATVALRATAAEAPYFQLIDGEPVGTYAPADGSSLLVFPPCQPTGTARPGWVDLYNLGFHLPPGRTANVEVLSSGPGTKPTWLTFTAPS